MRRINVNKAKKMKRSNIYGYHFVGLLQAKRTRHVGTLQSQQF